MNSNPNSNEIFSTVSDIIVDALRIGAERIKRESSIFLDFGAESLDILDIQFRIERTYGFKIDRGEIIQSLGEGLSDQEIGEKFTVGNLVQFIENRLKKSSSVS